MKGPYEVNNAGRYEAKPASYCQKIMCLYIRGHVYIVRNHFKYAVDSRRKLPYTGSVFNSQAIHRGLHMTFFSQADSKKNTPSSPPEQKCLVDHPSCESAYLLAS